MKLSVFLCVAFMLLLPGCWFTSNVSDAGMTPKLLNEAADRQKDSTGIIDDEAGDIQSNSKDGQSVKSAGKILNANVNLKNNIQVLKDESKEKAKLLTTIAKLQKGNGKVLQYILYGILGIGIIISAAGLVVFIKSGMTLWHLGTFGMSLVVAALLTEWLALHLVWFIAGIGICILVAIVLHMFLRTDEVVEESVRVVEQLKARLQTTQNGRKILAEVFGNETDAGIAGQTQSKYVTQVITAKRKKLHKGWRSVVSNLT